MVLTSCRTVVFEPFQCDVGMPVHSNPVNVHERGIVRGSIPARSMRSCDINRLRLALTPCAVPNPILSWAEVVLVGARRCRGCLVACPECGPRRASRLAGSGRVGGWRACWWVRKRPRSPGPAPVSWQAPQSAGRLSLHSLGRGRSPKKNAGNIAVPDIFNHLKKETRVLVGEPCL